MENTTPKETPWQRRTSRLQARLDKAINAIRVTHTEWRDRIAAADHRVANARAALGLAEDRARFLEAAILDLHVELAELTNQHAEALARIPGCKDAVTAAEHEHEATVGEPTRRLHVLGRARDRVAYRLQLHRARRPLTSLTGGQESGAAEPLK